MRRSRSGRTGSVPDRERIPKRPLTSRRIAPTVSLARAACRAGEPALASRIASSNRSFGACWPALRLDRTADQAPAGPGVLLLSDSDQVTHYYIEACQTLRIGIGNLTARRTRQPREPASLRSAWPKIWASPSLACRVT